MTREIFDGATRVSFPGNFITKFYHLGRFVTGDAVKKPAIHRHFCDFSGADGHFLANCRLQPLGHVSVRGKALYFQGLAVNRDVPGQAQKTQKTEQKQFDLSPILSPDLSPRRAVP
jgi:hypothetical protein